MIDTRYGVFLRPDPATCWAVTQITDALKQQYGLISAAAFPPHATLVGNLQPTVSEAELEAILGAVFEATRPFPVYNHGVARTPQGTFRYDVNQDESGHDQNAPLAQVAAAVRRAVLPIHQPHDDYLAPNVADYVFAAHLSLANFELQIDQRRCDEIGQFIEGLPVRPPTSFVACWYGLFQFNADWQGRWWENMPWRHVKSWRVTD